MSRKISLGIDIGSSSVKASLLNLETGELIASHFSPSIEMEIIVPQKGYAEQDPEIWWKNLVLAVRECLSKLTSQDEIASIGISYQMHGLVMIDNSGNVLYPSIIWCDSRAVEIGKEAFDDLGNDYCLENLLNSPGNFTASKLKWILDKRPNIYEQIYKIMLPGDYIAYRLTDEINTTISGLSEGIFWNFTENKIDEKLLEYFGLNRQHIPEITNSFGIQGLLSKKASEILGLREGIPVSYRAGDQPNNAFSLNVLRPGEIATTAGTSGVVYGVTDKTLYDNQSRVNTFAHINYAKQNPMLGVLLCINGTGISNSWLKKILGENISYAEMNSLAKECEIGSEGLNVFPFGNGAERVLGNKDVGGTIEGLNFNKHSKQHLIRAVQEGIAFSFRYGIDIMKELGMEIKTLKAGDANMFLSPLFCEAISNLCKVPIDIYNTDGAQGAARGAAIGSQIYNSFDEAFEGLKVIRRIEPNNISMELYNSCYLKWISSLNKFLL